MRGDFSRVTFRPEKHFSGVLLQQGRVQLDAEFNEHVAIEAYRDLATTRDVIGRAGVPIDGGGFGIAVASMLRGVAARDDAWAVGEGGTILRSVGRTGRWSVEPVPGGTGTLNAVDVGQASGWAVGDAAVILRLGDGGWATEPPASEVTADLYGVHGDASGAWAVGGAGTVLSWTGTEWERQGLDTNVSAALRDVHFSGDAGLAVGDDGTILGTENRGEDWTVHTAPDGAGDLFGVFLADPQHAWAVGAQGTVLVFDGTGWAHQQPSPGVTVSLRAVAFTSTTAGTAVGDGGTVLAFDDGAWQQESAGVDADLSALAALPGGGMLAVGDNVALTRPEPGEAWDHTPAMPMGDAGASGRSLVISAGDIYVEGVRCENERTVSLDHQPEPPVDSAAFPPDVPGTYGVYLRVQEEHLTATEHEELREVALGGPDTATRTRTVWQAGLVKLSDEGDPTCADVAAASPQDPPRGMLRARAVPVAMNTSECIVPPNGGYRRLENQLYRVEIHDDSSYVWSRDNGSVVARLEGITTSTTDKTAVVTVSHVGRDATVGFGPEQIVEITDQGRMLRAQPGVLAHVDSIEGRTLLLSHVDEVPLTMADFPVNPIVRRWDGTGTVQVGSWLELEDGVFVEFADGPTTGPAFWTGDYWTIPARTLTGQVEWPRSGGVPRFEQRHGQRRHTVPLATASVDAHGVWSRVRDCRKQFPPLTDLVHMYYVGGDGQEAVPPVPLRAENLVPLDRPLQVGIANGGTPVAGAVVDFAIGDEAGGSGRLDDGEALASEVAVVTDVDGVATCRWHADGATRTQYVEARFRDPLGQSAPQVVRFTAQLGAAQWVAYDGTACRTLAAGQTVDDAITTLSRITRIFPLSGSGEDLRPGESLDVAVLVASDCGPVEGATVVFKPGERGHGTIEPEQATTTADGVAGCRWTPDSETPTQDLTATLDDVPAPTVLHVPDEIRFVANLNLASDTAYSPPDKCPELDGIDTVQAAIDRLVGLLPRLYHVSGDGLEGPVGSTVELRAGIANRCGVGKPQVRLEVQRRETWGEVETVAPGDDDIASFSYDVTDDPRQFLRAVLVSNGKPVGLPVYFTVSPVESGAPASGGLSFNLERVRLTNVEDPAGTYQYEGGRAVDPGGQNTGNYASTKRVVTDATPGQNVASLTITIFVLGTTPPENLTLQGVHEFNRGTQVGSVSAASPRYVRYIGRPFRVRDGRLTIGEPEHPV